MFEIIPEGPKYGKTSKMSISDKLTPVVPEGEADVAA
jgi:hypothetical protein